MAEGQEGNPLANVQKTTKAQQERVEELESNGFTDELTGERTRGGVRADYKKGQGGFVETIIHSGQAALLQSWSFDAKGKLSRLSIYKAFGDSPVANANAGLMRIERDQDGKLQIADFKVTPFTADWEKEFARTEKRNTEQTSNSQLPRK